MKLLWTIPEWLQLQPLLFLSLDNPRFILSGGYLLDSNNVYWFQFHYMYSGVALWVPHGSILHSLSSDAENRGNPLVSRFQDELDPDDSEPSLSQLKSLPQSKNIVLTSDEEEAPSNRLDEDLDSEPDLKA